MSEKPPEPEPEPVVAETKPAEPGWKTYVSDEWTPGYEAPPYTHTGYNRFFDPDGYPAVKPPWGTLNAIDLNTGDYLWKVPLGEYPELIAQGLPPTGTENYGGPVVTAGGVLFIAASKDENFRAFDTRTGRELWRHKLPAGGFATPATYEVDGRQYVVIACGGGKMGNKSGDSYVAFALPE
jgi:quinoprotein glucose dehydrogenase